MTENVEVLIDGTKYGYWSDLEITRSIDTFSTCSFKAPFQPERKDFRETFRPFSFKPLQLLVASAGLFKGSLVGIHPQVEANSSTVDVTGYALPAVLADCNAPASSVPHQFSNVSLRTIAEALAKPFGIPVDFRDGPTTKVRRMKLDEEKKIFDFLTEIAKQQNRVFSNTADGVLLCWKSVAVGHPVATIIDEQPLTGVTATFNPQEYFSEITGFGTRKVGSKGAKHTEKNRWLPGVLRPSSFKIDDGDPASVPEATRARLGRMFANMASWTIDDLPTWRDPQGDIWEPNTTIMIAAPRAMIYRRTELLIRSVSLKQNGEKESASLEVVLPGAFSGEVPDFLPWEEPLEAA